MKVPKLCTVALESVATYAVERYTYIKHTRWESLDVEVIEMNEFELQ